MPKIPTYTSQTQPSGQLNVRAKPVNKAQGFVNLGKTLLSGAEIIQQQREKTAQVWREKSVAEARGQWAKRLQEMQDTAEPGAPEFTENFEQEYKAWREETLGQAPTEQSKQALDADLERLRSSFLNEAITFESRSKAKWRVEQVGQTLDTNTNTVRARPDMLDDVRAQNRQMIDGLEINGNDRAAMQNEMMQRTAAAAVNGQLDQIETPEDALDVLIELRDTDKWKSEMSEQDYASALNRAMRRVDQLEASQQKYAVNVLKERIDEHRAGIDNGLSVAEAQNIADPQLREQVTGEIRLAKNIYSVMDDAKSATPEERADILAEAQAALAKGSEPGQESSFYEEQQIMEAAAKTVRRIEKALANDPAM